MATRDAGESQAVENYLKQIHVLAQRIESTTRRGGRAVDGRAALVSMGGLADALELTPGTVTTMVKRLARRGLVRYERYGGVALTDSGTRAALAVLRRHRLIETFLVRVLGLDWSEVHDEAERLEHVLSDRVLEALDRVLGHPAADPHGDPIPGAGAAPSRAVALAHCAPGARVRIERLLEQSRDFLRFASRHGLTPGAAVQVVAPGAARGVIRVKTARRRAITLDRALAERVLVVAGR